MRFLPAIMLMAVGCSAAPAPAPSPAPAVRDPDVQFMQDMIGHHAQAIDMADLVEGRTTNPAMKLLAQRITISQRDEIGFMQRWLKAKGHEVPGDSAHHHAAMGHGTLMPGMLTQEDLDKLTKASGVEFERLFLQYMIRHHEGAIAMVQQLFKRQGTGQDAEVFVFAGDVDADQNAEIRRMRAMLDKLQ